MVAYMHNQGAANDGKHANLLSLMWCAPPAAPRAPLRRSAVLRRGAAHAAAC
jgi:hypothetical protein